MTSWRLSVSALMFNDSSLFSLSPGGPHVHNASSPSSGSPRGPRLLSALGPLLLPSGPSHLKPQAARCEDQVCRHQHPGWRPLRAPGGRLCLSGALSAGDQRQPGGHRLARDGGRSGT